MQSYSKSNFVTARQNYLIALTILLLTSWKLVKKKKSPYTQTHTLRRSGYVLKQADKAAFCEWCVFFLSLQYYEYIIRAPQSAPLGDDDDALAFFPSLHYKAQFLLLSHPMFSFPLLVPCSPILSSPILLSSAVTPSTNSDFSYGHCTCAGDCMFCWL